MAAKRRIRWTPKQKFELVSKHIKNQLAGGPKTFDELRADLIDIGVTEHYFSDVIRDLLLHERSIGTETDDDRRVYYESDT